MTKKKLNKFLICILLLTFLLMASYLIFVSLNKKIKPRNIFTKAIDSIVELRCEKGLSIVYGTAIIYNKEGYLVTNAHVVTLMHGDSVIEYSSYHVKFATEND